MVYADWTLLVCRIRQRRQIWIGNKDCKWIFTESISTAKSHLRVGQKEPQF